MPIKRKVRNGTQRHCSSGMKCSSLWYCWGGLALKKRKYLRYFPEPLLRDLVATRWLPVVGAGLSLNAAVPPGKRMPLWQNLADALSADQKDFSPNGPLDAISAYEHEFSRPKLVERLFELLLIHEAQPGRVHRAFCQIPFDIVCTTNFDFLLDAQYQSSRPKFTPVVQEDQLSIKFACWNRSSKAAWRLTSSRASRDN